MNGKTITTQKSFDNSFGALENEEEAYKEINDINMTLKKKTTTIKSQGKGGKVDPISTKEWMTKSFQSEQIKHSPTNQVNIENPTSDVSYVQIFRDDKSNHKLDGIEVLPLISNSLVSFYESAEEKHNDL